ncbi:hypothetical protein BDN72DRAFT_896241 [Pluteus cervinus]|uniref:Uncharacterized protein n=1 Tax=Pluteus cervinus TaxID=181527 RepID=A0ACD3AYH8_9AGAR|nr:hypothetical protein BDN72DRAFT_896241 [Pluteus cervinus]
MHGFNFFVAIAVSFSLFFAVLSNENGKPKLSGSGPRPGSASFSPAHHDNPLVRRTNYLWDTRQIRIASLPRRTAISSDSCPSELQVLVDLSPKFPSRTHRMQAYNLTPLEVLVRWLDSPDRYPSSLGIFPRLQKPFDNMSSTATMQAVVYNKPFGVTVKATPRPKKSCSQTTSSRKSQRPVSVEGTWYTLVILWLSSRIVSDLYMYEGRMAAEPGIVFGAGKGLLMRALVSLCNEEVGTGVTLLKKGDRIVMPFNVACGRCLTCEEGRSAFAPTSTPALLAVLMDMSLCDNIPEDKRNTFASHLPTSTHSYHPVPNMNKISRCLRTLSQQFVQSSPFLHRPVSVGMAFNSLVSV